MLPRRPTTQARTYLFWQMSHKSYSECWHKGHYSTGTQQAAGPVVDPDANLTVQARQLTPTANPRTPRNRE